MKKIILQSLTSSLLTLILTMGYSIITARLLGADGRGVFSSVLFISGIIASLSQYGFGHGYVYFKRKYNINVKLIVIILLFVFFSAFISSIFISELLPSEYKHFKELLMILSVVTAFSLLFQQCIQVEDNLKVYNVVRVGVAIVNILLIIVLIALSYEVSVNDVLIINTLSVFAGVTLLSFALIRFEFKDKVNLDVIRISKFFNYSVHVYGTSVIGILINNIDKILILSKGSFSDFGIYAVAYSTSRVIGFLPQTMSTILFSKFAGKNDKQMKHTVNDVFSLIFIPMLILGAIVFMFAFFLIPLVFGQEFEKSVLPFGILLFECIISGMGWIIAQRFIN